MRVRVKERYKGVIECHPLVTEHEVFACIGISYINPRWIKSNRFSSRELDRGAYDMHECISKISDAIGFRLGRLSNNTLRRRYMHMSLVEIFDPVPVLGAQDNQWIKGSDAFILGILDSIILFIGPDEHTGRMQPNLPLISIQEDVIAFFRFHDKTVIATHAYRHLPEAKDIAL